MILRTSYAKLAEPSRRDAVARMITETLEGGGHRWLQIGVPADAASEVWDLVVLAECPDEVAVSDHHRRIVAVLGDHAVVLKAWSFVSAP